MKTHLSSKINSGLMMVLAALLLMMNSCSKDKADLSELLKTVPSSSAAVVGINLTAILEKAGCKVDGPEITPGKELQAILNKSNINGQDGFDVILNGESGIDPSGAVVFTAANRTYLTFSLADTDKFNKFVSKKTGQNFTDASAGVKVNGSIAVKGAQAWIELLNTTIDPVSVAAFSAQKESQSFLTNTFSEKIALMESDVIGWGEINSILKMNHIGFSEMSMFNLVSAMLFEDAASLSFSLNFDKGKTNFRLSVLDNKNKPAKFLLPMDKIDASVIKELGGTCNGAMAFTITPKLVDKIKKLGSAFGGTPFANMEDFLKNVDGTCAIVGGSDTSALSDNFKGIVSTSGPVSQDFKNWLAQQGSIQEESNCIKVTKGNVSGVFNVDECADLLKGAMFGIVMDTKETKSTGLQNCASMLSLCLKQDSEGVGIDATIVGKDKNEYMLLSILKATSK